MTPETKAAMERAARAALEAAAKAARGQYASVSKYDMNSPFYGMDLTPDRSDWGRGTDRGREDAAAAIRAIDPVAIVAGMEREDG